MYLLTVRTSADFTYHFLGTFPEFAAAKKEITKHIKAFKAWKEREKALKKNKVWSNIYLIHQIDPGVTNTLEKCEGTYTEFLYSSNSHKLRKTIHSCVMQRFTAFCSPAQRSVKETQLEEIVKKCGGEVTGIGTDFKTYDFSVLIPLQNTSDFKKAMKEAKFRFKDCGADTPYIY